MKTSLATTLSVLAFLGCQSASPVTTSEAPIGPAPELEQSGPKGPCQLTVTAEIQNLSSSRVLLKTVARYDFDDQMRPVRRSEAPETRNGSLIELSYAEGGHLAQQRVEAGPGQFMDVYRSVIDYDDRGYPLSVRVDIGRDGQVDQTSTYENTYDEADLRSRQLTFKSGSTTEVQAHSWTPDPSRTRWTYVIERVGYGILFIERYDIQDNQVVRREVDQGGDGTVDFVVEGAVPQQQVETTSLYDEVGRPTSIEAPALGERTVLTYEDTCGGVLEPTMSAQPRLRIPGLRPTTE
jgi:hypothetical protein